MERTTYFFCIFTALSILTKHEIIKTRIEIECDVMAHNKYLKPVVKNMNIVELLRNAHPLYRENFAKRLFEECSITEKTYKLFKSKKD